MLVRVVGATAVVVTTPPSAVKEQSARVVMVLIKRGAGWQQLLVNRQVIQQVAGNWYAGSGTAVTTAFQPKFCRGAIRRLGSSESWSAVRQTRSDAISVGLDTTCVRIPPSRAM
jgi:hypothetical protein